MPRIDPLQLLKCLSVLLSPEGGILSRDEVPRLVNLMMKFSKKLVSKCVYVLILKNTQKELVDMFMSEGGWNLIQTWLQDAVQTNNWDLVKEILGLLLVTPVDVERLKLNILPKLIKSLSRREELDGVSQLSTELVQHWLSVVKGNTAAQQASNQAAIPEPDEKATAETESEAVEQAADVKKETTESDTISANTFYNSASKNDELVLSRLRGDDGADEKPETTETSTDDKAAKEDTEKEKDRDEKHKSSSKSRLSSSSSSRDKDRDRHRDKDRKRSSSKSSSSSRDKDRSKSSSSSSNRDKDRKDRDRHRHNGEAKKSSSRSSTGKDKDKDKKDSSKSKDVKENKEKQAEKDKDTLAKLKPPTIDKLGKIPKKANAVDEKTEKEKEELNQIKKKFSVGVKKNSEERPKTVKVFNSKMRSTGLEEEVKPAPPRPVKKPTPSVQLPTIPMKRPSPPRESHKDPPVPPEKKLKMDKVDLPERPGAIKLIPPKPKPAMLQESDLFNDALTAATTKKEPKKRKRRLSASKDAPASPTSSPARSEAPNTPTSPTSAVSSPSMLRSIAPINFYQDTLTEQTDDSKDENKENNSENDDANHENKETPASPEKDSPSTPTDDNNDGEEVESPKKLRLAGELKGVLLFSKKKGPKKAIKWKNDADLVDIRYFELDETERVNVTKTFGDMSKMEMEREREGLQLSRKVGGEDFMEPQIMWRIPMMLDVEGPLAAPGSKSLEKDIQFAREKSVLPALYFDKRRIPDSPEEPIPENHQMSDPVMIPLEDPESQEYDLRSTPWPEPKGFPPQPEPQMPPQIFPPNMPPFAPPFGPMGNPAFQGMPPRFPGPVGPPAGPPGNFGPPANFGPPNMMPNGGIMGPPNMGPPNDLMNMNPNMFPQGPMQGPMSDGFIGGPPVPDFPMFTPDMPKNMPNNVPNMFQQNNFRSRGGFNNRRGNNNNNGGNWVRMNGPDNNWKRGGRGGHRGGRLCKNVQNHGFCRNRENCPFVHPT